MMYALPVALVGVALLAYAHRREPIVATAGVLLANWGLNTLIASCTDQALPWPFFMALDYVSALAVLMLLTSKWQAAVLILYVAQILFHGGYGASISTAETRYFYWWALFYTGWAQALVCGGWLALEGIRLSSCRRAELSSDLAFARKAVEP